MSKRKEIKEELTAIWGRNNQLSDKNEMQWNSLIVKYADWAMLDSVH